MLLTCEVADVIHGGHSMKGVRASKLLKAGETFCTEDPVFVADLSGYYSHDGNELPSAFVLLGILSNPAFESVKLKEYEQLFYSTERLKVEKAWYNRNLAKQEYMKGLIKERPDFFSSNPEECENRIYKCLAIFSQNASQLTLSEADKEVHCHFVSIHVGRMNHSCSPNCYFSGADGDIRLKMWSTISMHEEIVMTYLTTEQMLLPAAKRQDILKKGVWQFECDCHSCSNVATSDPRRASLRTFYTKNHQIIDGSASYVRNFLQTVDFSTKRSMFTSVKALLPNAEAEKLYLIHSKLAVFGFAVTQALLQDLSKLPSGKMQSSTMVRYKEEVMAEAVTFKAKVESIPNHHMSVEALHVLAGHGVS